MNVIKYTCERLFRGHVTDISSTEKLYITFKNYILL